MIQTRAENTLTVHISNHSDSSNNDIATFLQILKICKNEAGKPGFKGLFDDKQRDLIERLLDDLITQP